MEGEAKPKREITRPGRHAESDAKLSTDPRYRALRQDAISFCKAGSSANSLSASFATAVFDFRRALNKSKRLSPFDLSLASDASCAITSSVVAADNAAARPLLAPSLIPFSSPIGALRYSAASNGHASLASGTAKARAIPSLVRSEYAWVKCLSKIGIAPG
jgi:hypothetical protein